MNPSIGKRDPVGCWDWLKLKLAVASTEHLGKIGEMLAGGELDGVIAGDYDGCNLKSLEPLCSLPKLTALRIHGSALLDVNVLQRFHDLKVLSILGIKVSTTVIDLTPLVSLEELTVVGFSNILLPSRQGSELMGLRLNNWKTPDKSVASLVGYRNLRRLILVQCNIENLEGIDRLPRLEICTLGYNRRLSDIASISATAINFLRIDHCGSIQDFSVLSKCRMLKTLRIMDSGSIQSLKWVARVRALEELVISGTTVLDNDLSPAKGVRRLVFNRKKTYFPSDEELRKTISEVVRSG